MIIKTIIFDFDGTIADTLSTTNNILQNLSTKYGYKNVSDEESRKMRDYTIQEIFKKSRVSLYKLPRMVYDVKREFNKSIVNLKPIKGMKKVLLQLKKEGYTLAIITSNNRDNVEIFLRKNELNIFNHIYTGMTIFGKARVIQRFLNTYHLNKKEVLYVGDEIRDIQATKKVGISIIAGSWGFNSTKGLKRFAPEFIVDTPKEIIAILRKLNH